MSAPGLPPFEDSDALRGMITPSRTALVVIDVQRDFAAPDGAMARAGLDLSRAPDVIERIRSLMQAARNAEMTIAFTRVLTNPRTDSRALRALYARKGLPASALELCREGRPGSDYYRAAPQADDLQIAKRLFDPFQGTDLEARLKDRGIEALILVGFTTDCCVEAAARSAFERDFDVFVVADATEAYDVGAQEAALRAMYAHCALITTQPAVTAWCRRSVG